MTVGNGSSHTPTAIPEPAPRQPRTEVDRPRWLPPDYPGQITEGRAELLRTRTAPTKSVRQKISRVPPWPSTTASDMLAGDEGLDAFAPSGACQSWQRRRRFGRAFCAHRPCSAWGAAHHDGVCRSTSHSRSRTRGETVAAQDSGPVRCTTRSPRRSAVPIPSGGMSTLRLGYE